MVNNWHYFYYDMYCLVIESDSRKLTQIKKHRELFNNLRMRIIDLLFVQSFHLQLALNLRPKSVALCTCFIPNNTTQNLRNRVDEGSII